MNQSLSNWCVLGSSGFIGNNLCNVLLNNGCKVTAFDHAPSIFSEPNSYRSVIGNFLDDKTLTFAIGESDIVVHLISTVNPATSNSDPERDARENLLGTLRLMEICREKKVKKLIILSSGGTIYGSNVTSPTQEDSLCDPICSYGIIKLAIENYTSLYRRMGWLDSVVLRVANPFGPHQIARGQGFIAAALERALRNEVIEVWGDGSVIRDYIYIEDVVKSILCCAKIENNSVPHKYNIGSGHGRSINNVLETIEEIHGSIKVIMKPSRPVDVPVSVLDIRRAISFLDWRPETDWELGMRLSYEWMKKYVSDGQVSVY